MKALKSTPVAVAVHQGVIARVGPFYRWVILLLTWLALLVCFVDRLAWSNVALDVGLTLNIQMTALGAFVTAFYVGYVLSNAAFGFATDFLGPRLMLGAGLVVLGVLTFAFGFMQSFLMGACIQLLMGLASGVDYSAGVKLNTAWFSKPQRGTAFGFYMTATSLAVIVTNSTVPLLVRRWTWTGAYEILGVASVLVGVICFVLIRNAAEYGAVQPKPDFSLLLKKPDLILVAAAGFGAMWGTWGFAFWANALMVKGRGLTVTEAAGIMVLFGLGAIVAKPVIGVMSDWFGARRKILTVICLGGFGPALLVFGWNNTAEAFRYMAPVLGVFAFAYSPLMGAIVAEIAGADLAASATGLTNALWQIGSVVVPVVIGALFQATGSFHVAFAGLAVGPAIAAIVMAFVRAD
jgi:MFS transporter, ACS family, glucarate transporter